MSDFTVYKPRNGQILKNGRVMSASDLAVELTQLQATNERLTAERDGIISAIQNAVDKLALPKTTPLRKEYFKAGVRSLAAEINNQLRQQAKGKG